MYFTRRPVLRIQTPLAVSGLDDARRFETYLYQASGMQKLARGSGLLKLFGKFGRLEQLAPPAEVPFFFNKIGKTFPAEGERQHRVAMMAGCLANVSFARLNEATVRVLQKNGIEVVIPNGQGCCGALHVHAGIRDEARKLARRNIDAVLSGSFDAVITNAAGWWIDPEGVPRTSGKRPRVRG